VKTSRPPRDHEWAVAGLTGYAALGWLFRDRPGPVEASVFAAANHHGRNHPALRAPQQLGTPWVLPALALGAAALRRPHLALAAGLALPLETALEVGLKKVVDRERPAQADLDAVLHDDAPEDGPSYPSGHAAIASTAVFLVSPNLRRPAVGLLVGAAAAASAVRVSQGAHFPADAVGGVLLGLSVASVATAVVGRPETPR
jgi:undecaprenyl-diphosphatase